LTAIDQFSQSIELDEGFAMSYFGRGYALQQIGGDENLDESITDYSKVC
jgi:hypothetical protein